MPKAHEYPVPRPGAVWLSVDPGLGGTGFAVWHDVKLIESGSFVAPKTLEWHERAHACATCLLEVITKWTARQRVPPHMLYYELPQFIHARYEVNASQDLIKLTMTAGIIAGACRRGLADAPQPVRIIDWKGQLPKELCNQRIMERLPKGYTPTTKTTHELDAIGIGMYINGHL